MLTQPARVSSIVVHLVVFNQATHTERCHRQLSLLRHYTVSLTVALPMIALAVAICISVQLAVPQHNQWCLPRGPLNSSLPRRRLPLALLIPLLSQLTRCVLL
jgi:hypothetical protein